MLKRYNDFIIESLSYTEDIDDDGDNVTIKAILNGKEIGHVYIQYITGGYSYEFESEMSEERYDELFPDDKYAKIVEINTNFDFRRQGYAKLLMAKALKTIKEHGENRVYLNANPMDGYRGLSLDGLLDFYESFGFKIIVDDYDENKEMLLALESYKGTGSTERTIDAFVQMHGDEAKEREEEKREERDKEEEERPDVIIDEFDEDTPYSKTDLETQQPSMTKNVSLAYGKTNMP